MIYVQCQRSVSLQEVLCPFPTLTQLLLRLPLFTTTTITIPIPPKVLTASPNSTIANNTQILLIVQIRIMAYTSGHSFLKGIVLLCETWQKREGRKPSQLPIDMGLTRDYRKLQKDVGSGGFGQFSIFTVALTITILQPEFICYNHNLSITLTMP